MVAIVVVETLPAWCTVALLYNAAIVAPAVVATVAVPVFGTVAVSPMTTTTALAVAVMQRIVPPLVVAGAPVRVGSRFAGLALLRLLFARCLRFGCVERFRASICSSICSRSASCDSCNRLCFT